MDKKLLTQSLVKFFLGVILLGALIFLPAGSFKYWQGWLLMGILFVPMFVAGLVMLSKNPELLRKRLNAKEQEDEQKTVVKLSGMLFIAAFVVAGLNWRFGWWVLPDWAVWVAAGLFLASYLILHHAGLHSRNCKAHSQRRNRPGRGPGGICRIQREGEVQDPALYLVT